MAYYDRIAKEWHKLTGHRGGALKAGLLNDLMLERLDGLTGQSVLELGAGNGYFMPLVLRRFSGQQPRRLVISDISPGQLQNARKNFPIEDAEYLRLDVRRLEGLDDDSFDLVIASMLFNELEGGFVKALGEIRRVLAEQGRLLATVVHPDLVYSLKKRDQLQRRHGVLSMPGKNGLRLPVALRSRDKYLRQLEEAGFLVEAVDVFPTPALLKEKPGLRKAGKVPVALLLEARVR